MSELLAASDAALKFEQLKMLAAAVLRAKEDFEKSPGPKSALVLQAIQQDYRELRGTMRLRVVN